MPLAWALAVVFGTSSTMAYVSFAWMPTIPAGIVAGRRRTVEDEWERRHGRW
ncbi:hypothetical protein [Microbacterium sp. NPDC087592]|uniref:hypothetical protein n=1 Tax=Microbacterium sp. NPDC087592 TaxID=3364193 RepID=UPI0038250005